MGVVSPLGIGCDATEIGLRSGLDCVAPVEMFDVSKCRSKSAGHAPSLTIGDRRSHSASRMMMSAAVQVAEADVGFRPEIAVIGTTSGGMSDGEAFFRTQAKRERSHAAMLANYPGQRPVLDALRTLNSTAPAQIIANACASGTNALGHAFRLIRAGLHDSVLAGGYDALSELVFVGFDSLQAATSEKVRPFDRGRSGLVLGEGAALLAIEERDSALRRGARILAEVTGYGISTDNHHLTQPHPSGIGPELAMSRALADAGRSASEIDYINAHGTATAFNDSSEGVAIAKLFGSRVPVSSTKGMMGHSLGAAGAIEAVFCVLALNGQFLPPNINYREPDPAFDLNIVENTSREATVQAVLSNSFGFGGTNASIVLEACR
jgi:3-oxoacyl-[acyl-carrier-protein] synthase II